MNAGTALCLLAMVGIAPAQQTAKPAPPPPTPPGMRTPSGRGTTTAAQAAARVEANGPARATAMIGAPPPVTPKAKATDAHTAPGAMPGKPQ